jgi:hypothetical protein
VIVYDPSGIVVDVVDVTAQPEHADVATDVDEMTHEHESDDTVSEIAIDPIDTETVPDPLSSPSVNDTGIARYVVDV